MVLLAYAPPYCCVFYYKDGRIYKQSELLGHRLTAWSSLQDIPINLNGYEFSYHSLKWAILRGIDVGD